MESRLAFAPNNSNAWIENVLLAEDSCEATEDLNDDNDIFIISSLKEPPFLSLALLSLNFLFFNFFFNQWANGNLNGDLVYDNSRAGGDVSVAYRHIWPCRF